VPISEVTWSVGTGVGPTFSAAGNEAGVNAAASIPLLKKIQNYHYYLKNNFLFTNTVNSPHT